MLPLRRLVGAAHPEDSPTQGRSAGPNLPADGEHADVPLPRGGGHSGRSGHAAGGAAGGQLVARVLRDGLVLGALAGQVCELALDLTPDPPDGDAEDALAALHEVDDLVGRGALV